ncbi:melanocortin receptor 4-like [Chanodichthys erythropterus]|uniref:melanocortin receptor 4-like n=1 Tax=Chanodichthys erythropterus TaxID=933992 RepID=UPI00351F1321
MGSRITPPATVRERMDRLENLLTLKQQGNEVGGFAQLFWTLAVGLGYNDAALMDLLNDCLDNSLPLWEMDGLGDLDFWGFVLYLQRRSRGPAPSQLGHAPASESVPEVTEEVGTEPPLHPGKRRRRRRKRASFILQGPEASPASESAPILSLMNISQSSAGLGTVLPLTSFENVLLFLFNVILATAIIFLNVSVFLSIVMNRSLRSENRFMYMLSTCLSDICSGVSYYYVGVLDVRDYYDSPTRTFYIAPTFLGLSYMAILAAQADRYHAVSAPFKYSQRMTRNTTLLVILAYWLYAFLIVAVNNLVTMGVAKKVTGFGTFVANIFTVIIMIGLNVRLFFIAKFQLEREPPSAERDNKRASIYLIIIVAVCFLIAWLPIFLHVIACNFAGSTCYTFRNEGSDPLRILPRVNAVLTPLLYIRGCSALRSTLLSKVWRTQCCKRKSVNPLSVVKKNEAVIFKM